MTLWPCGMSFTGHNLGTRQDLAPPCIATTEHHQDAHKLLHDLLNVQAYEKIGDEIDADWDETKRLKKQAEARLKSR